MKTTTTADEDGDCDERWSQIPMFLVDRVMQLLQWETHVSRTFRLVCRQWQLAHDGLLPTLRLGSSLHAWHCRRNDGGFSGADVEAVELMWRPRIRLGDGTSEKFPGVKTLSLFPWLDATDECLHNLLYRRTALTSLHILGVDIGCTREDTSAGLRSLSNLSALCTLDISLSKAGTLAANEGLRAALPSLTKLSSFALSGYNSATDELLSAVSACTALTSLRLYHCNLVTDDGLQSLSSLAALTGLTLLGLCSNQVTSEGVARVLHALPALTSLKMRGLDRKVYMQGGLTTTLLSLTNLTSLNNGSPSTSLLVANTSR
eukprot:954488-Prorocentrum_minimum.AAC.1